MQLRVPGPSACLRGLCQLQCHKAHTGTFLLCCQPAWMRTVQIQQWKRRLELNVYLARWWVCTSFHEHPSQRQLHPSSPQKTLQARNLYINSCRWLLTQALLYPGIPKETSQAREREIGGKRGSHHPGCQPATAAWKECARVLPAGRRLVHGLMLGQSCKILLPPQAERTRSRWPRLQSRFAPRLVSREEGNVFIGPTERQ